jgi:hypothetical protein
MHKSDEYGTILLKQKDKQTDNQIKNFALKLVKHLPFTIEVIELALQELFDEGISINPFILPFGSIILSITTQPIPIKLDFECEYFQGVTIPSMTG